MRLLPGGVLVLTMSVAVTAATEPTPAEVAQEFYRTANQGKCGDAERFFTTESLLLIKRTLAPEAGFARFCGDRAGKSPLSKLSVREQKVAGDRASVVIQREYQDDSLAFDKDDLVKQGTAWKLVVGENSVGPAPKQ